MSSGPPPPLYLDLVQSTDRGHSHISPHRLLSSEEVVKLIHIVILSVEGQSWLTNKVCGTEEVGIKKLQFLN